jgi:GTP-binding protein
MTTSSQDKLRNIAIIAHVDHGKTTFVDFLIRQTLHIRNVEELGDLIMDSNDQERERGITILAKNASIYYNDHKINIVDTPGHADFGGEVERTLRMIDGAVLIVDAQEGPMPQTKFVLKKAIQLGLKIMVVINKIDKPASNIPRTLGKIEDLFLDLGANDDQLDFPVLYAIGVQGKAGKTPDSLKDNLFDFLDTVIEKVPAPKVNAVAGVENPLQLLVLSLKYDNYKGKMAVGRITGGYFELGGTVRVIGESSTKDSKVSSLMVFDGLATKEVQCAEAGEIVMVAGMDNVNIGDTITSPEYNTALPRVKVDEPTIQMSFAVNTSPFAGKEGKFTTSRQIRDRLYKELEINVALRVVDHPESSEKFIVSGRGELHLSVLIESMRREGFELEVGAPKVIFKEENGTKKEPYEIVEVDVPGEYQGIVMQTLGTRQAMIQDIAPNEAGTEIHFTARIATRALLGMRNELITATKGTAIVNTIFDDYDNLSSYDSSNTHGSLVSTDTGKAMAYSLDNAQQRGELFIPAGIDVYKGMVIGQNSRTTDLPINPTKGKAMSNVRSKSSDDALTLTPPRQMTLENCLEYIGEDELVEVTPINIRIRKVNFK